MHKVLVANRGEIAVRVVRACADAGMASVAVYAEPDSDAPFVRMADEAFALGGSTAADSYLDSAKILAVAGRSGADAVHPGYGFLAENPEFAAEVLDAGLTWIGPSPDAIRRLGDKVTARHIATRAGAPLVPGTVEPVASSDEVTEFAREHGLPVAIKAAHGGGGRGLKVARHFDEIPELHDSAVREAEAAFGRGECFVERYLDRPRHVEAQVLADHHGNVSVVGTRDCSLQRRHQKLVEEAPAPFLSDEQRSRIHGAAKAICRQAEYHGAGTVEFLVGNDGTLSFLEVNTRLQVEHPVTEETTGIDLVRQQFEIAAGEPLRLPADPVPRGHAIEFRINGEDGGRGFVPTPGTITGFVLPAGPGVRIDAGVETGSVIGGQFDSLLAKVIVTGCDRAQSLQRARRALAEMSVEGLATVLPFHRIVLNEPAFTSEEELGVHTRWIETEFDGTIEPYAQATETGEPEQRKRMIVEVAGRRVEVSLPSALTSPNAGDTRTTTTKRKKRLPSSGEGGASGDAVTAPMQGTVVSVTVREGQHVAAGETLLVVEAMKMENPVVAHKSGTVIGLKVEQGDSISQAMMLCELKD